MRFGRVVRLRYLEKPNNLTKQIHAQKLRWLGEMNYHSNQYLLTFAHSSCQSLSIERIPESTK